MNSQEEQPRLKLLMAIVDRGQRKKLSNMLKQMPILEYYIMEAFGTASHEILDLVGVNSIDKSVAYCIGQEKMIPIILDIISFKMEMGESGNGIAFTMSVDSIVPCMEVDQLKQLEAIEKGWKDQMGENNKPADKQYSIVVAMTNEGYSNELMEIAKAAGATGGTVFQAKRKGTEDAEQFLGFLSQPEKEVVMILTKNDQKQSIMETINEKCGTNTPMKARVFAMPVDDVTGIQ